MMRNNFASAKGSHRLFPQVAKILGKIVDAEKPGIVVVGKQAIDDDSNQTGQMLAGLLDWPQATFASKVNTLAQEIDLQRKTIPCMACF